MTCYHFNLPLNQTIACTIIIWIDPLNLKDLVTMLCRACNLDPCIVAVCRPVFDVVLSRTRNSMTPNECRFQMFVAAQHEVFSNQMRPPQCVGDEIRRLCPDRNGPSSSTRSNHTDCSPDIRPNRNDADFPSSSTATASGDERFFKILCVWNFSSIDSDPTDFLLRGRRFVDSSPNPGKWRLVMRPSGSATGKVEAWCYFPMDGQAGDDMQSYVLSNVENYCHVDFLPMLRSEIDDYR